MKRQFTSSTIRIAYPHRCQNSDNCNSIKTEARDGFKLEMHYLSNN